MIEQILILLGSLVAIIAIVTFVAYLYYRKYQHLDNEGKKINHF